ncbi:TetR/AcrR family transcriptional regulator [Nakamurella lactea]|uniref:TetR/AcrR family transcriptional regulator n=1 Tax=Nakamurella lactea TaxID=459515 RepID=UPI000400708F|nr:TetR/AcrR family transcriptional regulator [Nakamurella lactea]
MTTRDEWVDEGLEVLGSHGLPGVRIDRIAGRLGVSKGSFHHHFQGIADYRRALLARYEQQVTQPLTDTSETAGEQTLRRLADQLADLYNPRIETAMRAWALHDEDARTIIARVDAARLSALTMAWTDIVDDPETAGTAALIPHLVAIGAAAAVPPLDLAALDRVYRMLVDQIPAVAAAARTPNRPEA